MGWLPGIVRYFDGNAVGPAVTDDMNDGFQISDLWVDETANKAYVCLDNAVGAAVWQELGAGGGGESDHGDLDGLADDDHSQYHTDARGDARYSVLAHNHDLVYAALAHDHDDRYYTETETDLAFAVIGHDHDSDYAADDHNHDSDYISVIAEPTAGNLAEVTAGGELVDSGYDPTDFAGASHNHDSDYISVVGTPTEGNLPELTSGGELADSGYAPDDFAEADHDHNPASQCAVLVTLSEDQNNFAINSAVTVLLDTETFDLGSDFNSATYTFTAPKDGKYAISCSVRFNAADTAASYYYVRITTSNANYVFLQSAKFSADTTFSVSGSILADMDEDDTATLAVYQSGGSQQTDLLSGTNTFLSIWAQDAPMFETDHGGLEGLSDDDHSQYALVDGARAFTGTITTTGAILSASAAHTQLKIVSDTDKRANLKLLDTDNDGWSFRKNTAANGKQFEIAYTTDDSSYTDYLAISANGEVTKPLQPAFQAKPASDQTDIAVGSSVTVVFGTEMFDVGSDFASNTFTAPVTGKYQLNAYVRLDAFDTVAYYYYLAIVTSNRTYRVFYPTLKLASDGNYLGMALSVLADMDASDTAYVVVYQHSGTQQTDIIDDIESTFSGFLTC